MRDYQEKYLMIYQQFPNKAGKLKQIIETQKRLITKLSRTKQSETVNELLISASEGYDVADELLNWTKDVLQGVLNDAGALKDGATILNTIKMQSDLISHYMSKK